MRNLSLLLVVVGLVVSGYLSYVRLVDQSMVCAVNSGFQCDVVQNSVYAKLFGIPVAYLGFLAYVAIAGILTFQNRIAFLEENGMVLLFGAVFFSFLFSIYLIYVQSAVLQAWCQWCLIHEINITVLLIVTGWRLREEVWQ